MMFSNLKKEQTSEPCILKRQMSGGANQVGTMPVFYLNIIIMCAQLLVKLNKLEQNTFLSDCGYTCIHLSKAYLFREQNYFQYLVIP